jgi:uncharacterized protein
MQTQLSAQERNWAMAAHLSALVGLAGLPFGHILGPLVVYLAKGHESEFVGEHSRASLNYQITVSVVLIVASIVAIAITFGFLVPMSESTNYTAPISFAALWVAFGLGALVVVLATFIFIILGTVAASEGRPYNYPVAIRFLR